MRKKYLRIVIFIGLITSIIIVFFLINSLIFDRRKISFKPICDKNIYAYQVENISIEGDYIFIKGWFFELKKVQNIEREPEGEGNPAIVVYDMSQEKESYTDGSTEERTGLKTETIFTTRPDINKYFKCEHDYSRCGFETKIEKTKINLENGLYQIIIKPHELEEDGIQAAYIVNGELTYISPLDTITLNVKGTDLEKIVTDGTCVVSYPKYHVCVYQYGWELYWIVDKDFDFDGKEVTHIQYFTETTQFDKLPKNRTDEGKYWSNLAGVFEMHEITSSMNCGEYRVSVRDLPTEYSLTQMGTGYRVNNAWVWERFFRPDYRLIND